MFTTSADSNFARSLLLIPGPFESIHVHCSNKNVSPKSKLCCGYLVFSDKHKQGEPIPLQLSLGRKLLDTRQETITRNTNQNSTAIFNSKDSNDGLYFRKIFSASLSAINNRQVFESSNLLSDFHLVFWFGMEIDSSFENHHTVRSAKLKV